MPLLHLFEGGGASHQQHQVGVVDPRDPHLLPVHDVAVAPAHRHRLHLRGVGPGRRLGHPERLQPQLAARDLREIAAALLLGPVPEQGAHDVHLGVAGGGVAARPVDLLEDDRRLGDAETRPAQLLRYQGGEVAGLGQGPDELLRVRLAGVELAPVGVGKPRAELAHRSPQIGMQLGVRHDSSVLHVRGRRPGGEPPGTRRPRWEPAGLSPTGGQDPRMIAWRPERPSYNRMTWRSPPVRRGCRRTCGNGRRGGASASSRTPPRWTPSAAMSSTSRRRRPTST